MINKTKTLSHTFFRRFRREDDAVVAIQVVIFSVMLLTSAGLVIDFGRAYSAHSQMQSFVDKAALAAANQLDGEVDAMTRATAAAVAVSQTSTFTDEDESFAISLPLTFMIGNPIDSNGNFSEAQKSALSTTTPAFATHVHVEAEARSIRLAFLSISLNSDVTDQVREDIANQGTLFVDLDGNGVADGTTDTTEWQAMMAADAAAGGSSERTTEINLTAYAVARMQVSFCGELSTMVMCNPFENDFSGQSFTDLMVGQEGTRMMLTTDRDLSTGVPIPLSTDDGEIRVGLFKDPRTEIGADAAGVCSDAGLALFQGAAYNGNTAPLTVADPWTYPTTDEELERLRDTCLLATIDSEMQCIGGEVLIKPAEPETITTAINTLFDIWDAPMDRVLTQAVTTGREFSPDYVAAQGRITRAEWQAYMNDVLIAGKEAEIAEYQTRIDGETVGSRRYNSYTRARDRRVAESAELAARLLDYPDNIANIASRRNHMFTDNTGGTWGPMLRTSCLSGTPSCSPYTNIHFALTEGTDLAFNSNWRAGPAILMTDEELGEAIDDGIVDGSNPGNDKETGSSGEDPNGTGTEDGGGTMGASDGFGVDDTTPDEPLETEVISLGKMTGGSSGTGWEVRNYTDIELIGNFGFENSASYVQIVVPALSKIELQTDVRETAVLNWSTNHGLSYPTAISTIDNGQSYAGMDSGFQDLTYGRVASFSEYFSTHYSPYIYANGLNLDTPASSFEWSVAQAQTLYDGYSTVERQELALLEYTSSGGPESDGSGIRGLPEHYQFTSSNPSAEQLVERRRQQVALVNCQAMSAPVSYSGVSDAYAGAYVAELEAVVDLFFTEPVVVNNCATTVGDDPQGQMDCWNSQIDDAHIAVEYLGSLDPADPDANGFINYAVLVH